MLSVIISAEKSHGIPFMATGSCTIYLAHVARKRN